MRVLVVLITALVPSTKVANRAAQAFRQAAQSVSRSDSSFGAFFRAMRARKGPQQAIVATAHKLARTVYALLKNQTPFEPEQAEVYEERRRERERRQLERRAALWRAGAAGRSGRRSSPWSSIA